MGNHVSAYVPTHQRLHVLENTPFAMFLNKEVLHDIALCFGTVKFEPGAPIVFQKHELVIVAKGTADVSTIVPQTAHKKVKVTEVLCKKRVGDILTSVTKATAIMQRKSSSAASYAGGKNVTAMLDLVTVTADKKEGCVVLRLNRERFLKIRSKHIRDGTYHLTINRATKSAADDWQLISSIADEQVVDYLAGVPFFADVTSTRLLGLAGLCSFLVVQKDDVVCRENDLGDRFYICIEGLLQVTVTNQAAKPTLHVSTKSISQRRLERHRPSLAMSEVLIRRLANGSYFGEISLLLNVKRSATVKAVENSLLVYIEAPAFRNFIKVCPDVKSALEEVIIARLLQITTKHHVHNFVAAMKGEDQCRMAQAGSLTEVTKGTTFIHEDDEPMFYIVLNGLVEVEYPFPTGKSYVTLPPGGYCGEISVMLHCKSLITATAAEDTILLVMTPVAFHSLFSTLREVFSEFLLRNLQELARIEDVIDHYEAHELWLVFIESRPTNFGEATRTMMNGLGLLEEIEEFVAGFASMDFDELRKSARTIVNDYLSLGAPKRVPISAEAVASVAASVEHPELDKGLFRAVRTEMLGLMGGPTFTEFKSSPKFKDLLESYACVPDIPSHLSPSMLRQLSFDEFCRLPHTIVHTYSWSHPDRMQSLQKNRPED
ncbi:hypothetical protein SDRG_12592 [Saprolegnia diclina VS20]|uniref:Cyclic nucleotide-binding domain-containing protein n=1 Tax=Saprolegnia diclina (strain VS20) TaxID=1156394 RepID=T0RBM4_SAPDV|nr:hypothetical protein SDRG_12592 [Saprolegnia diclina VS20]EQC29583.1 hypothetical protein SDRG_12592 [Saprolegnia diclina VS20]|eukprot:XP_008616887.1 hypothetical protein SDRG_12592 [Saprolegnia diclina VS20]